MHGVEKEIGQTFARVQPLFRQDHHLHSERDTMLSMKVEHSQRLVRLVDHALIWIVSIVAPAKIVVAPALLADCANWSWSTPALVAFKLP